MSEKYWDEIEKQIINGNDFGSAAWAISVKRIIRQIATDQREATILAIKKFYQDHLNCDWTDADLYDAIRNAEIKGE